MIESDVGVFEAEGNEMLVRRVDEINAIAHLKKVFADGPVQERIGSSG